MTFLHFCCNFPYPYHIVVMLLLRKREGLCYATHDTCLTHGHRKLRLAEDFEILCLTCDFKTLRLMPARHNISKHCVASQTQHFEIRRQVQDFKLMRLTLFFVTIRQKCSTSLAMSRSTKMSLIIERAHFQIYSWTPMGTTRLCCVVGLAEKCSTKM